MTASNQKTTIMYVEDNLENRILVRRILMSEDYAILEAVSAADALNILTKTRPDLILMDIQLPRMDGFEATRKLRSEPDFRYTPIIALTALAMPSDRERCLAAGMDEYISKPINLKALVKLMEACLFNREEPGPR